MGKVGMSVSDFWECTPREISNIIEGFTENQNYLQQQEWERTRMMTVIIANSSGNLKKPLKYSDFKFAWDKKVTIYTKEERKRIEALSRRLFKHK